MQRVYSGAEVSFEDVGVGWPGLSWRGVLLLLLGVPAIPDLRESRLLLLLRLVGLPAQQRAGGTLQLHPMSPLGVLLPLLLLPSPPREGLRVMGGRLPHLTMLLLPLLPETLGFCVPSTARARAVVVSLSLQNLWRSAEVMPMRAVLTPSWEAPRVPTPRRVLLLAVHVHAVLVLPDELADPGLPELLPASWVIPMPWHLGPCLSLGLIRHYSQSTPIYERISRSRCTYVSSHPSPSRGRGRIVYAAYAFMIIGSIRGTHHLLVQPRAASRVASAVSSTALSCRENWGPVRVQQGEARQLLLAQGEEEGGVIPRLR